MDARGIDVSVRRVPAVAISIANDPCRCVQRRHSDQRHGRSGQNKQLSSGVHECSSVQSHIKQRPRPRKVPKITIAKMGFQIAHWRRDLAGGIERAAGVALEPVEIETQGPERNERRQDRVGRAVQPALRLGEFVTRDTAQFGAGGSVGAARAVAGGDVGGTLLPVSGLTSLGLKSRRSITAGVKWPLRTAIQRPSRSTEPLPHMRNASSSGRAHRGCGRRNVERQTEIQDVSGVTTQEKVEKFEPSSAWPSRAAEGASLDPRLLRQKVQGPARVFRRWLWRNWSIRTACNRCCGRRCSV